MEADGTNATYQLHTDGGIQDATEEEQVPLTPERAKGNRSDIFRDESAANDDDDAESYEEREMTLQELMYSSSSFYAIVVPGE
jgi:hypothetical protein